jgi:hypothetical protein
MWCVVILIIKQEVKKLIKNQVVGEFSLITLTDSRKRSYLVKVKECMGGNIKLFGSRWKEFLTLNVQNSSMHEEGKRPKTTMKIKQSTNISGNNTQKTTAEDKTCDRQTCKHIKNTIIKCLMVTPKGTTVKNQANKSQIFKDIVPK